MERRPPGDTLPRVREVLARREGFVCVSCIAVDTGLPIEDVRRCLQAGTLIGFTLTTTACAACGTRAWCASYRPPPPGSFRVL